MTVLDYTDNTHSSYNGIRQRVRVHQDFTPPHTVISIGLKNYLYKCTSASLVAEKIGR